MADTWNGPSDLVAVAAMPGLEEIAEVLAPFSGRANPVSLLLLSALQASERSRNRASSLLQEPGVWEAAVRAAASVGRSLPDEPPTQDQLSATRRRGPEDLGERLSEAFTPAMKTVADDLGVLRPGAPLDVLNPRRVNTLYGDGTVFKPLSGVRVDARTGEVLGSRSDGTRGPQLSPMWPGKDGSTGQAWGTPVTVMGVHGGEQHRRMIVAVGLSAGVGEIDSSMELFDRTLAVYGEGVHALIYDGLMSGPFLRAVMHCGVVPIVAMPSAGEKEGIAVPEALQWTRGVGGRRKSRAVAKLLETVKHRVGDGFCARDVWALDGGLRSCGIDRMEPSFDDPVLDLVSIGFEPGDGRVELVGRFRVRCEHGGMDFEHVFSTDRFTIGRRGATAMADFVRPVNLDNSLRAMRGWRSDAESVFATFKRMAPLEGRATSLSLSDFLGDVIGAALLCNARARDVHVNPVSGPGRRAAKRVARRKIEPIEELF